jgi:uncharacterized phage protein (TIGR01671 family)
MRELKFRGICIASNKIVTGGGIDSQRNTPIIINQGVRYHVSSKTVGQFTGLQDINGTDIYEGDIVVVNYDGDESITSRIGYCDTSMAMWLIELSTPLCGFVEWGEDIKVIGNIYENKELLEGNE